MKKIFIFLSIFLILIRKNVLSVQSAAIICYDADASSVNEKPVHKVILEPNDSNVEVREGNKNSLNKLFQNIQCTLEKAKPWVAELQQEAKRLEEAAKILSLGILNSFGEFVDKLVQEDTTNLPIKAEENSTEVVNVTASVSDEISEYLCPEGFIADHNGICERIE